MEKSGKLNNVLSISGGKDSTAMLLEMLKRGENIHSAVFFDTGWEFPQMYDHIAKLESYTGIRIWRLHPTLPFDYWMIARPIIARKGSNKGKVHRIGNGWPSKPRRWCTRIKANAIDSFSRPIPNKIQCIGFAADEDRLLSDNITARFPLQEYGITEKEALNICYRHGFDWDGLYGIFDRVSCFCCPLQKRSELKSLFIHFPDLWARLLEMDAAIPNNLGFLKYTTAQDLDKRFKYELSTPLFANEDC